MFKNDMTVSTSSVPTGNNKPERVPGGTDDVGTVMSILKLIGWCRLTRKLESTWPDLYGNNDDIHILKKPMKLSLCP